jgi:hypothetical protein
MQEYIYIKNIIKNKYFLFLKTNLTYVTFLKNSLIQST